MPEPSLKDFRLTSEEYRKAQRVDKRLPMRVFSISVLTLLGHGFAMGELLLHPDFLVSLFIAAILYSGIGFLLTMILLLPIEYVLRALIPIYSRAKDYEQVLEKSKNQQMRA